MALHSKSSFAHATQVLSVVKAVFSYNMPCYNDMRTRTVRRLKCVAVGDSYNPETHEAIAEEIKEKLDEAHLSYKSLRIVPHRVGTIREGVALHIEIETPHDNKPGHMVTPA